MRRIFAFVLALCLFLSAAPMGDFAAETVNPACSDIKNYFYKIMHLDAARKYFSVEKIKGLIDVSADAGFSQIKLYQSDNQGFRLINTNGDYYHILGGDLCTPDEAAKFDYEYYHSFNPSKNIYLTGAAGFEIVMPAEEDYEP